MDGYFKSVHEMEYRRAPNCPNARIEIWNRSWVYVVALSYSDHCNLHLYQVLNLSLWGRALRQVLDVVICDWSTSNMLSFWADCRFESSATSFPTFLQFL